MAKWTKRQQAAHRRKWIKALRSGEYKQGVGRLKRMNGSFCCLGVACEISGLGKWDYDMFADSLDRSSIKLTPEVRDWLGLNSYNGEYIDSRGRQHVLTEKNDGANGKRPLSFKQIANIIEREPKGLIQQ